MKRVLFLCTANSARSLMAEAVLRDMAGDRFEVASAGTQPTEPHPMALRALEEAGLSMQELSSQPVEAALEQPWDYVITLCDRASRECKSLPVNAQHIAWDFPDPVETGRQASFNLTLTELRERIELFVQVHNRPSHSVSEPTPERLFKALGESTRLDILLLLTRTEELCVCEFTHALELSQPRISRQLGQLREQGLLIDERRGQWVYYRLHPMIPGWLRSVLKITADAHGKHLDEQEQRLATMPGRPTGEVCR
ncbi:arsenate reductase [Tamilnaduibacter salinus]|uniref:Arsenate reductase n=1 Tax=Tamilnaduibacter salinus TaxID=1484056 RepID=A0A2A2I1Y8_9GAMM|nr:metalloregulator ArsR/SmtB family transcription factor [Tamilnaduibacter salinus]PAV25304.1 arsenate reductase [Tamilnaduibacter salinus]